MLYSSRLFLYGFVMSLLVSSTLASANDNRRVANMITHKDLNELCPGKFLEIHSIANTSDQAGMAIMKIFWLVDSSFLKRAANKVSNPEEWGVTLGETFRYYCEKLIPVVTVRAAALSTISYLE